MIIDWQRNLPRPKTEEYTQNFSGEYSWKTATFVDREDGAKII